MKKKTTTNVRARLPKDLSEVDTLLAELGELDRTLEQDRLRLERHVARLRQTAKERTEAARKRRNELIRLITRFAKKHRVSILPEGRKRLELTSGTFGWRFGSPKVELTQEETTLITWLKEQGLERFLRYSVELNREQLLEERPSYVPGVHFEQKEFFFIEPKTEPELPNGAQVIDLVKLA